ncbi:putative transferase At4g12130, mitochondrial [Selaginella moellendorffii]|uniref:putative transferase At4g12130, mitochondrial n=1 Tax=Selaginella moellendorffii TaxID=88036 RepID=UPI000D1C9643|nr:putative transferase At4g12130, mitochondrial [Selaginella moellendorffii]|eukprot:XP_024545475.1 putative transferase At4g12130, mitochondrial [Selaginella moellendorffii]
MPQQLNPGGRHAGCSPIAGRLPRVSRAAPCRHVQLWDSLPGRSKANIEDLSKDLNGISTLCGALADPFTSETGAGNIGWAGGRDLSGTTAAEGSGKGWRWFKDLWLVALGFRSGITSPLIEAGQEVDKEYYLLWRLSCKLGEAIPLEYNMAALNPISFEKGCNVGQELIPGTHFRASFILDSNSRNFEGLSWFACLIAEMREGVARGTEIVDGETGKKVGSVITALGSRGLAMVRLEAAAKDRLKLQSVDGGCGASVKPIRPKWWPSQWGTVE